MRAPQQTSLEGPRGVRLITDAPVASPRPGEVLPRVTATGVSRVIEFHDPALVVMFGFSDVLAD
jgi:hypothetical protein